MSHPRHKVSLPGLVKALQSPRHIGSVARELPHSSKRSLNEPPDGDAACLRDFQKTSKGGFPNLSLKSL